MLSHGSMVTKGKYGKLFYIGLDNHSQYAEHPKQDVFLFSSSFFLGLNLATIGKEVRPQNQYVNITFEQ